MPSHIECVGYNCHFDRPKYHFDPFPSFKFPTKAHEHTTTEGITETITTLVTDTLKPSTTVKSITSEDITSATKAISTALDETTNAVSETFTDVIKATSDTIDKTTLTDIIEITSEKIAEVTKSLNESITDAIFGTSTNIGSNLNNANDGIMHVVSNSSITEILNTDTIPLTENLSTIAADNSEIITTASNVAESTTDSIFSQIYTSTEEIIKSITDEQRGDQTFDYHSENDNDNAGIYVILGIILAILLIIIALIIIVYIRYRKNKSHTLAHPYYDVHDKKDTASVSIENEGIKDRAYVNDVYVQYSR